MPLIPHLAHECWVVSTKKNDINDLFWPKYNPKLLKDEECSIVIQVDGRKRGILKMPLDAKEKTVLEEAQKIKNVIKNINNKTIVRNMFLKNKLVNFITKK